MHAVGIIPARSGSRRVPNKNIRELCGKPLIAWTIEAAFDSEMLDRVIVSTDSEEYADIAREYGAEVPFKRPKEIADDCDTALVIKHAVEFLEEHEGYSVGYAITLQPTSPLRTKGDIYRACHVAASGMYDSVVSVTKVTEFPAWMFKPTMLSDRVGPNGKWMKLESYLGIPTRFLSGFIAQDMPRLYIPNGAIYVTKRELLDKNRIFGDKLGWIEMPKRRSIDIEEEIDLKIAEALLSEYQHQEDC